MLTTKVNEQSILAQEMFGDRFAEKLVRQLSEIPREGIVREFSGTEYQANIVIPEYTKKVIDYYSSKIISNFNSYDHNSGFPKNFDNFGLCITFVEATELRLHSEDMVLPDSIKSLLNKFGVVILRNVYLDSTVRDMGHRNRFPHLNFHIDRNPNQVTHYSVFTRDPFDDVQQYPRTSSTLFLPPFVAWLQAQTEDQSVSQFVNGLIPNITLFEGMDIAPLIDNILIKQAWDSPFATGEISIVNNCNMLHASFYPDIHNKGYRIGVRYLS